jgi:hypothetical protein
VGGDVENEETWESTIGTQRLAGVVGKTLEKQRLTLGVKNGHKQ